MITGNNIRKFILPVLIPVVMGCAQQGAPTGGPKDEVPPLVVRANPANYSINFDANRILIEFDEFLDMANFTRELIVSPPMEEKPIVKLRNKTLIIEFEEELKRDVTYTFNFGEGISDLNEGNVLLNYEYVFSTGSELDSLSIKGTLKNAFDLTVPESPIFVMLYIEHNDSLPLKEIPYYVGRTDKSGNFQVNNLRNDTYKLFVLKDGNNNFLFDQANEQIAFLDTTITVDGAYFRRLLLGSGMYDSTDLQPDTTLLETDTTGMSQDSIKMVLDSLEQARPDWNSIFVDLFMFEEVPVNQYITDYNREERESMELLFNFPLTDSFQFSPVYPGYVTASDFIPEYGRGGDSLTIWAADTSIASLDTLGFSVRYTGTDTLQNYVTVKDTLFFTFREKQQKRSASNQEEQNGAISVKTINNKGKQDIYKDLNFTIDHPVRKIDTKKFEFYIIPDTIEVPVNISPFIDTSHIRRVRIEHSWKEEADYRVVLYPGAIENVYGRTNDTIDRLFSIKPISEYGRIILTLENVEDTIIVQIFQGKRILRERCVTEDGSYEFQYVNPNTYRIKFIHDTNKNGKWDTGKYLEGRQPEKVEFVPVDVQVRANWDHDITYIMGSNSEVPSSGNEETGEEEPPAK
ncbi:MAG: Ig-like domain-containing protein [Bacteroidales bacterium]|nr:Ig-like domain-containing protein [Bacteroidales bacterium]